MDSTYKTDDLSIASFLMVRGAQLREIFSDRPRHVVFLFEDIELCNELKRDYLNNGEAPARELLSRRSELVAEMKDVDGGGYAKS